jgi:hypothetical protein
MVQGSIERCGVHHVSGERLASWLSGVSLAEPVEAETIALEKLGQRGFEAATIALNRLGQRRFAG